MAHEDPKVGVARYDGAATYERAFIAYADPDVASSCATERQDESGDAPAGRMPYAAGLLEKAAQATMEGEAALEVDGKGSPYVRGGPTLVGGSLVIEPY